jgi:FkbM family methyltransferase
MSMFAKVIDTVRRTVWRITPNKLYKFGARFYNAQRVFAAQGVGVYRTLMSKAAAEGEVSAVHLRNYPHPIYFRPGTHDSNVIIQTLIREEYGRLPRNLNAPFIIDAGANIGDTAVYFVNRYKDCELVALEPHPRISALTLRNLAPYPNATVMKKGLWSHPMVTGFTDDSVGSSIAEKDNAPFVIECVDIPTILQEHGRDRIDILKMDIEGAELEVILHNSEKWIPQTAVIVTELHGAKIAAECIRHLKRRGFSHERYRSLHYFVNSPPASRA